MTNTTKQTTTSSKGLVTDYEGIENSKVSKSKDVAIVTPKAEWIAAAKLAIHAETAIEGLQEKERLERASVAESLIKLAKASNDKVEVFLETCRATEAWAKSEQCPIADRWETIPRCWTQAKSNIKAYMAFGFSLKVIKSEGALRTALNDKRKKDAGKTTSKPMVDLGKDAAGNKIDGTIVNNALQTIMETVKKLPNQAMVDQVADRLLAVEYYMLELLAEFDDLVGGDVVEGEKSKAKVA